MYLCFSSPIHLVPAATRLGTLAGLYNGRQEYCFGILYPQAFRHIRPHRILFDLGRLRIIALSYHKPLRFLLSLLIVK